MEKKFYAEFMVSAGLLVEMMLNEDIQKLL